jgi:hypothetical protein
VGGEVSVKLGNRAPARHRYQHGPIQQQCTEKKVATELPIELELELAYIYQDELCEPTQSLVNEHSSDHDRESPSMEELIQLVLEGNAGNADTEKQKGAES